MGLPDNISRFPYSRPRSYARLKPMTAADLAAARAEFLARWKAALPIARAAVAEEAQRIIARMKEGRWN